MHLKRVNIPQLLHIFTQLSLSAFWVLKITKNVSMAWWMKGTVYKRGETSNAAICMNRTNMRAMWYRCRACLNRKLAPFLSSRVFFRFSRGTLLRLGIRFLADIWVTWINQIRSDLWPFVKDFDGIMMKTDGMSWLLNLEPLWNASLIWHDLITTRLRDLK